MEPYRLARHVGVAVNGEVQLAVGGAMCHAYALVVVNSIDEIVLAGVDNRLACLLHQHPAAQRHVERVLVEIDIGVRRFGLFGYLEEQRFSQSLIVGEINEVVVCTDLHLFGVDGERYTFLLFRLECSLCGRDVEPIGQVLDSELPCYAGGVGDRHVEAVCQFVGERLAVRTFVPDHAVEVGIHGPHYR